MTTKPIRVPLFISLSNRNVLPDNTTDSKGLSSVDAKIVNGYVEKLGTGNEVVVKRPGYSLNSAQGPTAGGVPRGCYLYVGNAATSVPYWLVDGTLYLQNTAAAGGPVDTVSLYSFAELGAQVFFHNDEFAYWYAASGAVTAIPALSSLHLVRGAVALDGTMYVMRSTGEIRGSAINDVTTWPAPNSITAGLKPGSGVALFRQLNYLIALKSQSMEVFYDAGNPTGSPLASVPNLMLPYGCAEPLSLQVDEDTAFWVTSGGAGTAANSGLRVIMLQNMQAKIVSTPAVEKLLQVISFTNTNITPSGSGIPSWSARIGGHLLYGIGFPLADVSYVYDATSDEWNIWTDTSGTSRFPMVNSMLAGLYQGADGKTYQISGGSYQDNGVDFPFEIVTPIWDGGNRAQKNLQRLGIVGDQAGAGVLQIRHTDDDYQTWSQWRTVNLNSNDPAIYNCGSFRKRAWHLRYLANTPLRLLALELDIEGGSL